MLIPINDPELERFVVDQISSGRFRCAEDVVEAALHRLMNDESGEDFDDAAVEAILKADTRCERGEGRKIADIAADLRRSREQLDRGDGLDLKDSLLKLRQKYDDR
jgi:Arc/MetJ-type ribon-helix-helix transcriptional regulator